MDARRLLHWTDLESGRRVRYRWLRRAGVAAGLAALVAWRAEDAGLGTWHAIITAGFAVTMIGTALGMFWRPDAALLARLPIPGLALLQAAVIRAARAAVVTGVTVAAAAAPLVTRVPDDALLRGLSVIGTLTIVAAAFIPAAAAAAALMVAGGQIASAATQLTGLANTKPGDLPPERLPTTVLGALPGAAAAFAVILAITVRWWIATGEPTAVGSAPTLLLVAIAVSLGSIALVARRGEGMAVAMREVAALDRQRLAHLEIHPPRGLERVVMRLLPRQASLVYDRIARLVRRRYPMAWVVGFLAYLVAIPVAIWPPSDAVSWSLGLALATGAYALTLASRLSRPPIELPRLSLPIAPSASSSARVAWILLYAALFSVAPVALTTHALSASSLLVVLSTIALSVLLSAALAHRRRAA